MLDANIIGYCDDQTRDVRAGLRNDDIELYVPTAQTATGEILGAYAFMCLDCSLVHIRPADRDRILELVVIKGLTPYRVPPEIMPRDRDIESLNEARRFVESLNLQTQHQVFTDIPK